MKHLNDFLVFILSPLAATFYILIGFEYGETFKLLGVFLLVLCAYWYNKFVEAPWEDSLNQRSYNLSLWPCFIFYVLGVYLVFDKSNIIYLVCLSLLGFSYTGRAVASSKSQKQKIRLKKYFLLKNTTTALAWTLLPLLVVDINSSLELLVLEFIFITVLATHVLADRADISGDKEYCVSSISCILGAQKANFIAYILLSCALIISLYLGLLSFIILSILNFIFFIIVKDYKIYRDFFADLPPVIVGLVFLVI